MMIDTDHLSISELRRHLDTETIGRHIYLFDRVDSTNETLRRLAARGATEGTVVLAETATGARRRAAGGTFAPDGLNLYLSVLFRPELALPDVALFASIASLALTDAIAATGVTADVTWPHDVVVGGIKVGSVQVECGSADGCVGCVILGIGVNVNVTRAELETALGAAAEGLTSLAELTGEPIDRNVFAGRFLTSLEQWHRLFTTEGLAAVVAAWQARHAESRRAG
jgi:BirA family biotin operon repressor/biotin-[acetyl-CoA-carboxylase] ligase